MRIRLEHWNGKKLSVWNCLPWNMCLGDVLFIKGKLYRVIGSRNETNDVVAILDDYLDTPPQ